MNPTSEIKVVNVNKIIKLDDQVKAANSKKESPEKVYRTKPTARKRTGGPKPVVLRKRSPKKRPMTFDVVEICDDSKVEQASYNEDMEKEGDVSDEEKREPTKIETEEFADDSSMPPPVPEVVINDMPLQDKNSTPWSDDSEDEYVPDFDPDDSDSDEENLKTIKSFKIQMPTNSIKQENYEEDDEDVTVSTNIQIESLADFEYTPMEDSYSTEVKYEDEDNLFDEKDRILEHLLNENEYSSISDKGQFNSNHQYRSKRKRKMPQKKYSQDSDDILKESEMAYIKYEESDDQDDDSEDVLGKQFKVCISANLEIGCCRYTTELFNHFRAVK